MPCEEWKGRRAEEVVYLITPVTFAAVHHTATDECDSIAHCTAVLTKLQHMHIEDLLLADIGSK